MTIVTQLCTQRRGKLILLCDFSPPRGNGPDYLEEAQNLDVDFICVAYNPGKSVRVTSAVVAHAIKENTGKDVIFNLGTRDMNRLAIQSYLLGAQVLGLENVVILKGDEFTGRERFPVKDVNDFKPVELIASIKSMNKGLDFKGLKLKVPTNFCVGATIDLSKGIEREARLTYKKASAGADFFIAQSTYDPKLAEKFMETYSTTAGEELSKPVFYGIQILSRDSPIVFGDVPEPMKNDLERGRDGSHIALELTERFIAQGLTNIYLIPPILKGGVRDYQAAQRVIAALKP